jgi:hypothetical protein
VDYFPIVEDDEKLMEKEDLSGPVYRELPA